jgi:hypothetical protein
MSEVEQHVIRLAMMRAGIGAYLSPAAPPRCETRMNQYRPSGLELGRTTTGEERLPSPPGTIQVSYPRMRL